MDNLDKLNMLIKDFRRKVQDAADDVSTGENHLVHQQKRLDSLAKYQVECEKGFHSLPASAFFYAQRRECKLLLEHLDDELAEQQQRVDNCRQYIEEKTVLWRECEAQLKGYLAQLAAMQAENDKDAMPAGASGAPQGGDDEAYSWIQVGRGGQS